MTKRTEAQTLLDAFEFLDSLDESRRRKDTRKYKPSKLPCKRCDGDGLEPGSKRLSCTRCGGSGWEPRHRQ